MKRGKWLLLMPALLLMAGGFNMIAASTDENVDSIEENLNSPLVIKGKGYTLTPKDVELEYVTLTKKMEDQFCRVLNKIPDNIVEKSYFLYDITGDSVPELWVVTSTCLADETVTVYQFKSGKAKLLAELPASHAQFYLGDDYVVIRCMQMGVDTRDYIKYAKGRGELAVYKTISDMLGPDEVSYPSIPEWWVYEYGNKYEKPITELEPIYLTHD